jgi:hypothetical protein
MPGITEITDSSNKLMHSAENFAARAAQTIYDEIAEAGHQAALFGKGVVSGAVLKPINALEQLVNKAAGTHLHPLEFSNQTEVDNTLAGKVGNFGGTVLSFVATDGAVSAASGFARGGVASLSIAGALQGSLLHSSDEKMEGTTFFMDRLKNGTIDALTFATMGGARKCLAPFLDGIGETLTTRMYYAAIKDGISCGIGGMENAQATAILKNGRFATPAELKSSFQQNALFGMGMGIVGEAVASVAEVLRPGVEAPVLTETELAATRARLRSLVHHDENVSQEFVAKTMQSLERVHDSVLEQLSSNGYKIRLVSKIIDYDSSLTNRTPSGWGFGTWEMSNGLYFSGDIVIAETARPFWLAPYMKSGRPGVARHELGHGLDDAMGQLSQSSEFKAAHKADVSRIPWEWRSRLEYFTQPENLNAGRKEAFADLFALLHGGPCIGGMGRLFRQYFPETLKVVEDRLKAIRTSKMALS